MSSQGVTAATEVPTPSTDAANKEPQQQTHEHGGKAIIRFTSDADYWLVPTEDRTDFIHEKTFLDGLLTGVTFNGKPPNMVGMPEFDSYGEVEGVLTYSDKMPEDAVRTAEVVFDKKERIFHVRRNPEQMIAMADYLLLCADGSAFAGWKKGY